MEKVLASKLDMNIITSISELDYFTSSMTQEDVIEEKPFKLSVDDYENILHEILRRESIDLGIGGSDEIETVEI
eukprot:1343307-Ditylum_brightwellii.AAC.1